MTEIVVMADPRVAGIPVADCGEELVDLAAHDFVRVDERKADAEGNWRLVRRGVAERLERAAARLPRHLRLLHIEGYRPPRLQSRYFHEYREELAAALGKELGAAALDELASRYVSPPEIAPHSAGAAVDLTLCNDDGAELDMGTRVNAGPEESAKACYTDAETISPQARDHRRILASALTAAGLINYSTEWWHWSYGDRYWAICLNRPSAIYGAAAVDR